jgi:hypothetical protein
MRHTLIIASASVLMVALIAPAAEAASQIRHLQRNLVQGGAPPMDGGQIGLDLVFKNKPNSTRKFTPRLLIVVDIQNMPMTCTNSPGQPSTATTLTTTVQTHVKLKKQAPPQGRRPKTSRYAFQFATSFTEFTGTLSGKVFKRGGRGPLFANGVLTIDDLDFPGGPTNCSTMGPRQWG